MRQRVATTIVMATFLLAASSLARADENKIRLENAWARKAPAVAPGGAAKHGAPATGMGNGAVYVTIQNGSRHGDAVIAATSDAAGKVELHETVNEGGVMRMRPLPKFTVPAGGKLEMKPGSYHIMLLGLTRDLKPGDTVKVTLTFEKAGKMEVNAPVREGP